VKKLVPDEAKTILGDEKLLAKLAAFFDQEGSTFLVPPQLNNSVVYDVSCSRAVFLLLLAIAQFMHFAYLPWPTKEDVKALDVARQIIIATFVYNGWRIHAAPHYMLNHALQHFTCDGTAYFFVQEAIELANKYFRLHNSRGCNGAFVKSADVMKKHLFIQRVQPLERGRKAPAKQTERALSKS
jgi:hypothetical protein